VTIAGVALLNGRAATFGAAAVLALLTKPQASAFLPFFAVAALRYLPHGEAPHEGDSPGTNVKIWTRVALGGAVAALLMLAPFLLAGTLGEMVNTVSTTIGHGPRISSNAYNIWWLLGWGNAWEIKDTELLFGLVSYRLIGLVLLFGIANGLLAWKAWKARDRRTMGVLAVFAGLAFFVLPTEIHENYLFPTIPLLALATVHERGAWRAWAILSVTWFFNLVFVDVDLMDAVSSALPGFGALVFPTQVGACAVNIGVLAWWTWKVVKGR